MTGLTISLLSALAGAALGWHACRWTRPDRQKALEAELALARALRGVGRPAGGYDGRGAVRTGGHGA